MNYKAVIFDMDGTVLDTLDDLKNSLNFALEKNNMPKRTLDETRSFVGNGIEKLIERAVPKGTNNEDYRKVISDFTDYYTLHCKDNTKAYEGISNVIDEIRKRGLLTAVVSNKDDYGVKILCEEHFKGKFDCSVGMKDGIRKKPSPDSVNIALTSLGIKSNEAVYVGDSEVDIQTAENSDMDCISVLWGFRTEEFLRSFGGKVFAKKPNDILKIVLE